MLPKVLTTLVGSALSFAALSTSAPANSYGVETCGAKFPNATTVYVTIPQPYTVTVHVSATAISTVYITEDSTETMELSERPTSTSYTTVTRFNTLTSTKTLDHANTVYVTQPLASSSQVAAALSTDMHYETTIISTAVVTVTQYGPTPPPTFIVENGTTFWYNGQTPDPSQSYVVATSVVTVLPVDTPVPDTKHTSTLTLKSTVYKTHPITITETLSAVNTSASLAQATTLTSAGTGLLPIGSNSGWGGWNATSSAAQYLVTAAFTTANQPHSIVTDEPTFDIYTKSPNTYSLSTYSAKSGFNALTTPPEFFSSATLTSATLVSSTTSAIGAWTTSIISGNAYSWTGTAAATSFNESTLATPSSSFASQTTSEVPPFVNTTSPFIDPTASGAFNSTLVLPSAAFSVSTTSESQLLSPTSTTNRLPTSSSVVGGSSTSSALGVVTSLSSTTTSSSRIDIMTSKLGSLPPVTGSWTTLFAPPSSSPLAALSPSSSTVVVPTSNSPSTTLLTSTSTRLLSTASVSPTSCGETGDFTLNFDDIPPLSVSNDTNLNTVQPAPLFNPYHQFDFSDGFTVVPPPTDPYLPSSKPLLVEFIPNFNVNGSNSQSGPNAREFGFSGDIGNGDHGLTGCFSFNAYGASMGCDSFGPDCVFSFTGFRYDPATKLTSPVVSQKINVPACPALKDCSLTPVTLDASFKDLDSLRINVTVASEPKIWWMDDVRLGWYDNTCRVGLCRVSTHIH